MRGTSVRARAELLIAILVALAVSVWPASGEGQGPAAPNIVVVMTDDQTLESLPAMAEVEALIRDRGVTFSNAFVNFPLCCPSRATYLTGQYTHNNGVRTGDGFGQLDQARTVAARLRSAGYVTAHVGKYLNGYDGTNTAPLPGWDEFIAPPTASDQRVYDYDLNENGAVVHYGSAPADFKGDVFTDRAVDFVERSVGAGPFFLSLAYTAPHTGDPDLPGDQCAGAAKPAPRHIGAFAGTPLPPVPSFNEADVADKPADVRRLPRLTPAQEVGIARRYRCQRESLLHVDEGVARIAAALEDAGELDSTLIVFTSDNGVFNGEHRIPTGKVRVYEEAIRVPLSMRGPGVPEGTTVNAPATNADLAPTLLDAAGVQAGVLQDGISLLDLIAAPGRKRDLLVENQITSARETTAYEAVRTPRYLYAEYSSGERELYDMAADRYQLDSRAQDPAYAQVVAVLAKRLEQLRTCQGTSCRGRAIPVPSPGPRGDASRTAPAEGAPVGRAGTARGGSAAVTTILGGATLDSPYSLVASPTGGDIYVSDSDRDRIQQFTADGAFVRRWGGRGTGAGEFIAPRDLAVGPGGDVYVADSSNHRIQQFTADGAFVRAWGGRGSSPAKFNSPDGIAVGPGGDVYVADASNHRIQQFTATGAFIRSWGGPGTAVGQFNSPEGIAVGPGGEVYVADSGNDRIQEFTATGSFVRVWGGFGSGPGQLSYPRDLTIGPGGDVFVADTVNARVQRFDPDGSLVASWGSRGRAAGRFLTPRGIAAVSGGRIYVADSGNDRIQWFEADGTHLGTLGGGTAAGEFRGVRGVAKAAGGDLYVADMRNERIQQFTAAGAFVRQWGGAGADPGEFRWPRAVAVGSAGRVYVADSDNNRIQQFTAAGVFVRAWGTQGASASQFSNPKGIAAAAGGDIYVADSGNGRVQQFTVVGSFVRQWGASGPAGARLDQPAGIAVGADGDVYVTDPEVHRIRQYTATGAFIRTWGGFGTADGRFSRPTGVAVDAGGDVYVAELDGNRVQRFTADGVHIETIADPLLEQPNYLAATPTSGEVLVTTDGAVLLLDIAP